MVFEVRVSEDAMRDLDDIIYHTRRLWSEAQAERWADRLTREIEGLSHFPRRNRIADPSPATGGREVRVLWVRGGRDGVLVYYEVEGGDVEGGEAEGGIVKVLRLVHSKRDERP